MAEHEVVSHADWIAARQALLAKEKEFTRLRDQLSAARRALPWEKVEKRYVFQGPDGAETLADLFAGRGQLLVYHFMFGKDWGEGCKSCSFWADNFDGAVAHLAQRDVTMLAISNAPLAKLAAFKTRMGWRFKWVSSLGGDFNADHQASFAPEELKAGEVYYNYRKNRFPSEEAPGVSVFARNAAGEVFHTYSCYSRGLDALNGAYQLLDLVPKGRGEDALSYPMEWVKHRDKY